MAISIIGSGATQDYGGTPVSSITSRSFSVLGGELVTLGARWLPGGAGSVLPTSIADSNGNSYGIDEHEYVSSGEDVILASCPNAIGGVGNVITLSFSGGNTVQYWGIGDIEVFGIDTASPLDATAKGNSLTSPVTSGTFSTSQNDTIGIMVASNAAGGTSWTPGGGYTQQVVDSIGALMMAYQVYSSVQSGVTESTANNGAVRLEMVVGTYKAPAASTGQPTMRRWGGVPFVGGQGIGGKSSGRMWGRTRDGLVVPRRLAA